MKYEILNESGDVINTIIADEDFMLASYPHGNYREIQEDVQPEPTVPEPVKPPYEWYIDIGPFYDRFGAAKLKVLTSADTGIKAILADLNIRKWIDLKRPDVAEALLYVGSKIPEVTPEIRDSVLNTPVQDIENLALRKLYFW